MPKYGGRRYGYGRLDRPRTDLRWWVSVTSAGRVPSAAPAVVVGCQTATEARRLNPAVATLNLIGGAPAPICLIWSTRPSLGVP
jgi:hypothetical protein